MSHNEITSRITNLLAEREIYLQYRRQSVYNQDYLKTIVRPAFRSYVDAVEKGIVKPESTDKFERELDAYLIAKTATEWWIKNEQDVNKYVTESKLKSRIKSTKGFLARTENKTTKRAYKQALNICYTQLMPGRLVNMNFFEDTKEAKAYNMKMERELYKRNFTYNNSIITTYGEIMAGGLTPLKDVEIQPSIKEYIKQCREKESIKVNNLTEENIFMQTYLEQQTKGK